MLPENRRRQPARATLTAVAVPASLPSETRRRIETAVRSTAPRRQLVLAVSGGRDSMVLLHAFAHASPRSVVMVATFDHATGRAAATAAQLVAAYAAQLGLPVVLGQASQREHSEEAWRQQRQRFLREVAAETGGTIATAHTRDDQVETVLMRILRDAGSRGLAGLYAAGSTVRPLLEISRAEIHSYAATHEVPWIEDPTNESREYFRNRVRHDLLPALRAVRPRLEDDLLLLARRAADVRDGLDAFVSAISWVHARGDSVSVAAEHLNGYSRAELSMLWPAIAARVGLAMDWRGTERAAAFTTQSRVGARIQLSGGWEIARSRHLFELGRWR